jgi:glycosyltransferase involved in cell wall biosynthesis
VPADQKVALHFGDRHQKDPEVVLAAFATVPGWTLVVAGAVADQLDPDDPRCQRRFPGGVSDSWRDTLLSAADLVVLSFSPGFRNNSATLMDAISFGVPVVCPDDAAPASIVTEHRLGLLYTNGDSGSLADAVRRSPEHVEPADLARARHDLSNRAVAQQQLTLLQVADGLAPPP